MSILDAIMDLGAVCAADGARGPLKIVLSNRAFDTLEHEVTEIARAKGGHGRKDEILINTICGEVTVLRQSADRLEWIPYRKEWPFNPAPPKEEP